MKHENMEQWTKAQDVELRSLVALHGPAWRTIEKRFTEQRSTSSLRNRWRRMAKAKDVRRGLGGETRLSPPCPSVSHIATVSVESILMARVIELLSHGCVLLSTLPKVSILLL